MVPGIVDVIFVSRSIHTLSYTFLIQALQDFSLFPNNNLLPSFSCTLLSSSKWEHLLFQTITLPSIPTLSCTPLITLGMYMVMQKIIIYCKKRVCTSVCRFYTGNGYAVNWNIGWIYIRRFISSSETYYPYLGGVPQVPRGKKLNYIKQLHLSHTPIISQIISSNLII